MIISYAYGKTNILNRQYCSVFNRDNRGSEPSKGESCATDMPPITVTATGVKKMLVSLNPNKAPGPDMISPAVLNNLAEVMNMPIAQLFQSAIDTGEVPNQWKTVVVTLIFK